MTLSVLEICQEALEEIGVDPPGSLSAGGDLGAQLLAIANSTGRDIAKRGDWQALRTEGTFTTTAVETQVSSIKTSYPYLRRMLDNTMFNRTQQRRIVGPIGPQAWQRLKADSATPASLMWYLRGNTILFPGTPTASESVYFEYIDTRWCSNSTGATLKEAFTDDTDIPRLDDYAFVLGVRWRFLQKKGFEYGEVFREYEDWIAERLGSDRPHETLSLNPHSRIEGADTQIPDGNWNL
jgi:hypothetical protein